MTTALETLLSRAKMVKMSAAEQEAQRRSFAFGNLNIENPEVTRDSIDLAATKMAEESKDVATQVRGRKF